MSAALQASNDRHSGFFEDNLAQSDPDLAAAIAHEKQRQQEQIELILVNAITKAAIM
jgi:glycine hydroxymethyltransferase